MRVRRMSGAVVLAVGLGLAAGPPGAGAAEDLPPLVTTLDRVADGSGDVFDTGTGGALEHPRADITGASLEWAPGWIRMKVQVRTPTDPLRDAAWSDRSDAEWVLDTDGDGQAEYTVEFATDRGELYGAVFDVAQPDEPSRCDADSASFSAEDGYTLVIDPKCIGNPTAFGWAVAMFVDTQPGDEEAPMATDRVPDQGFKAVAAPVRSGQAAPPAATSALPAPAVPAQARPPVPAPPAPGTGAVPDPSVPRPGPPGAQRSGSAAPVPPGEGAVRAPLARTGTASGRPALFGAGIMLVGAGLLVMTRPGRRLPPAILP